MQHPSSGSLGSAPVFVCGTARSGSTVVAELIGHHPEYAFIPVEARFHAEPLGLCDLVAGRVRIDGFLGRLRNRWLGRASERDPGEVFPVLGASEVESLVASLVERYQADLHASARRFLHGLLDPYAERAERAAWVEMTPASGLVASTLARLVPDARFVVAVRDGRDVAASLVERSWGPSRLEHALSIWAERSWRLWVELSMVPAHRWLLLRLEDLVVGDRQASLHRLIEFLGPGDISAMERFFEGEVRPDEANLGRWRQLPASRRSALETRYVELVGGLREAGVPGRMLALQT